MGDGERRRGPRVACFPGAVDDHAEHHRGGDEHQGHGQGDTRIAAIGKDSDSIGRALSAGDEVGVHHVSMIAPPSAIKVWPVT